jgi:hypothetical protein
MKNTEYSVIENAIQTQLPDGYKELALQNIRPNHSQYKPLTSNIEDCLPIAFLWSKSPQGYKFWRGVQRHFIWQVEKTIKDKDGKVIEVIPAHYPDLPSLP